MDLGDRIKARRLELGLSQLELAHRMGLKSKSTICKVETGDDNLTTVSIQRFADALSCSPLELMGMTEEGKQDEYEEIRLQGKQDAELLLKFHRLTPEAQSIILSTIDAFLSSKTMQ